MLNGTYIKKNAVIKKNVKRIAVPAVVSCIPQNAKKFAAIAQAAGCDIFTIQSTVATVKHIASEYKIINIEKVIKASKMPIII